MYVNNISVLNIQNALRGMRNPKNSWDKSDSIYPRVPHYKMTEEYEKFLDFYHVDDLYSSFNKTSGFLSYKPDYIKGDNSILYNPYENKYCINYTTIDSMYEKPENQDKRFIFIETDHVALIGSNDIKLCRTLTSGGPVHSKYLREILVSMDITASLDFWKEWDTMKVGTVSNSCSTMHKITSKPIDDLMFSNSDLRPYDIEMRNKWIKYLNEVRDDPTLTDIDKTRILSKQLLQGYEQTRTLTFNYQNLAGAWPWRKNHKLKEWRWLMNEIIVKLPYFKEMVIDPMDEKNKISKETVEKILEAAGCNNNINLDDILTKINGGN